MNAGQGEQGVGNLPLAGGGDGGEVGPGDFLEQGTSLLRLDR